MDDATKARIRSEEEFRQHLRDELYPQSRNGFWRELFGIDNVKWIVVTVMLPLTTAVWGSYQLKISETSLAQEKELADARRDVDEMTALIPRLSNEQERDIALAVLTHMVESRKASASLRAAYQAIVAKVEDGKNSKDPRERRAAAVDAETIARSTEVSVSVPNLPRVPGIPGTPRIPQSLEIDVSKIPVVPRAGASRASAKADLVYLQIYNKSQRTDAELVREALRDNGIPVPGIENVVQTLGPKALGSPQTGPIGVRYFRVGDQAAAMSVANAVEMAIPQQPRVQVRLVQVQTSVRPGLVEVWFPCRRSDERNECD